MTTLILTNQILFKSEVILIQIIPELNTSFFQFALTLC